MALEEYKLALFTFLSYFFFSIMYLTTDAISKDDGDLRSCVHYWDIVLY